MITHCISTWRNLNYLQLAVHSVRMNSYYKDAPFIIHSDKSNDDGTNEWLLENKDKYNLTLLIRDLEPTGIGPGMNVCAENVETEFINFLHSDFYVAKNWDLELMKVHEKYKEDKKLWVNSFRIEPNMFNSPDRTGTLLVPPDTFGGYHNDFKALVFNKYAEEFAAANDHEIIKSEGVSGLVRKSWWDHIGGNDDRFAPTSWDDHDLFLRMLNEGGKFIMPTRSVVYHFGARGSHRLEENNGQSSERQRKHEMINQRKFIEKWGGSPKFDPSGNIIGIISNG